MQPKASEDHNADRALWRAFRAGDRDAFTAIYERHVYALVNYGEKMVPHRATVEDAIHDLFVDLWRRRSALNDTDSVRFYLLKGLKRKLLRTLSNQRRSKNLLSKHFSPDFFLEFSHEFYLIARQVSEEHREQLAERLAALPKREKEALHLRFYEEMEYPEMAKLMQISVKTAYNSVHNAIVRLRKSFAQKARQQ